jgi:hypothetical protein
VLFPSTTPFGVACGLRSFETALNSLIGKLTADCIGDNTVFVRGIYPNRKRVIRSKEKGQNAKATDSPVAYLTSPEWGEPVALYELWDIRSQGRCLIPYVI